MLNGSHSVDTVLWMLNTRADRVHAEFGYGNEAWQGEDHFEANLYLTNGVLASLQQSFCSHFDVFDNVIVGTEATIEIRGHDRLSVHTGNSGYWERPAQKEDPFLLQDREFALSILENREPVASGEDVRKVMEVLDAGRASARERRTVVI
jgi:predicted dehydrogenase